MQLVPVSFKTRRTHPREIRSLLASRTARTQGSPSSIQLVAREAIGLLKKSFAVFEPSEIWNTQVGMTTAAARVQILFCQHRLRPIRYLAVRVRRIRRATLAAMTDCATVSRRIMNNVGMPSEKSIAFDAALTRRHANVTTYAPIRGPDIAADDLPELNCERVGLGRRQPRLNLPLDHAPIAEKVFIDGGPDEHHQRRKA